MKRQVIVAQGTVEGLAAEDQGIPVFRGVPFAQPPVGSLRWRAPPPARADERGLPLPEYLDSGITRIWCG